MSNDVPVAIVTGAGGGIGRAISHWLSDAGYRLVLMGRTVESLEATAAEVKHGAIIMLTDVGDFGDLDGLITAIMQAYGRIDVIVNNAAVAPMEPLEKSDADVMASAFATNVTGPFLLVGAAWEIFRRQQGGMVVNISSKATEDPFPGLSVYAATKCGVESLTRSIMAEGGEFGMKAWSIAPGAVETPMLRSIVSEADLPTEAALRPDEIAALVVGCVTGQRESDVGTVIRVER